MKKTLTLITLFQILSTALFAADHNNSHGKVKLPRQASPEGAEVYIVSPKDGDTVGKKFKVVFGLKGMGVCPAGIIGADGKPIPGTGHHHLLINNCELPPLDMPLAGSDTLKHFGLGQTETMLELAPGEHTLQLVLADFMHVPHEPAVISKKIKITVK